MRLGRIATSAYFGALAVVNGPLAIYKAATDQATPYGWHSRGFWLLTAVVNVLIGAVGVRLIFRADARDRRRKAGLCLRCGYDLRASPAACPECGAVRVGRSAGT
jgi:hypothetical protein